MTNGSQFEIASKRFAEAFSCDPDDLTALVFDFNHPKVCRGTYGADPLTLKRLVKFTESEAFNFREGGVREWLVGFLSYAILRLNLDPQDERIRDILASLESPTKSLPALQLEGLSIFPDPLRERSKVRTDPRKSSLDGELSTGDAPSADLIGVHLAISRWEIRSNEFVLVEPLCIFPGGNEALFFTHRSGILRGNCSVAQNYTWLSFMGADEERINEAATIGVRSDQGFNAGVFEGQMLRRHHYAELEKSKLYLKKLSVDQESLATTRSMISDDKNSDVRRLGHGRRINPDADEYAHFCKLGFNEEVGFEDPFDVTAILKGCPSLRRSVWSALLNPGQPSLPFRPEVVV